MLSMPVRRLLLLCIHRLQAQHLASSAAEHATPYRTNPESLRWTICLPWCYICQ